LAWLRFGVESTGSGILASRSAHVHSTAPEPYRQESDQDSDPVSLEIPPLRPEAINQTLSDLNGPRETKDTERSRALASPIPAEQQRNDSRESKQKDVEKEVAGCSPSGRMQPQRLEGRYDKEHDPGRACQAQAIPAHRTTVIAVSAAGWGITRACR
jgi:hypothetical protein